MKNIFDVFTSSAKVWVIRTLSLQTQPIPLRHVACISDLPVFSVQNALLSLLPDGVVTRTEEGSNVLFEINMKSTLYDLLVQFFNLEIQGRIREEARKFSRKARHALEFANSASKFFRIAKRRKA